jgi:hypothetical protein
LLCGGGKKRLLYLWPYPWPSRHRLWWLQLCKFLSLWPFKQKPPQPHLHLHLHLPPQLQPHLPPRPHRPVPLRQYLHAQARRPPL